jgi:hypothetical protein
MMQCIGYAGVLSICTKVFHAKFMRQRGDHNDCVSGYLLTGIGGVVISLVVFTGVGNEVGFGQTCSSAK